MASWGKVKIKKFVVLLDHHRIDIRGKNWNSEESHWIGSNGDFGGGN